MKIPVACSGCHRRYEVDDRFAGKTLKCAHCEKLMPVPVPKQPAGPPTPDIGEYDLGDPQEPAPSSFRAAPVPDPDEHFERPRRTRPRKKTVTKPRRKNRPRWSAQIAESLPMILPGLAVVALLLVVVGYFVPSARKFAGMSLALPGLLLCLYGYATAVYIAFTEDDFYGWLFLLFPFYAAYYVVSRWDEMRSRLIMFVLGLTLLAVGGNFLEADRAREQAATPEAAPRA
jgi:hypothetical protein